MKTFGSILPAVTYIDRPGAYAIILNAANELAVIQTSLGYFLPGGGVDAGETLEQALRRELDEEIGFELETFDFLCEAVQYHWSSHYQQNFRKIGTFFKVTAKPRAGQPARFQDGHRLVWWSLFRAKQDLSQEFQRWAVEQL